jgi:hypothetical protein
LFGASLERVVNSANWFQQLSNQQFHEIERLRAESSKQCAEIERLERDNRRLRDRLAALERDKFQKRHKSVDQDDNRQEDDPDAGAAKPAKKRGAPIGHPGWYRPVPAAFDRLEMVVPDQCPSCGGAVALDRELPPEDHLQEDIIDGRAQVICYRHPAAICTACGAAVEVPGPGELLGCAIGPHARAMAAFLHFEIGLSVRKVAAVCRGLTNFPFSPAAVLGFEQQAESRAKMLADDVASKLQFSIVVYADETSWSIDGQSAHVWFHGNEDLAHYHIDASRAGTVSREILGPEFGGVLTTDCYAAYERHHARAKQKCLAHLRRTAKDWREAVPSASVASTFFSAIIACVARACALARARPETGVWTRQQQLEVAWLQSELDRLETMLVDHELAEQLQNRLKKHHAEWLVFLDHAGVAPTNNLAERSLRSLVILRKLTFGNRSPGGAERVSCYMTVIETAKRQGHRVLDFLRRLFTQPAAKLLVELYAPP